ncbi:ankyrin repeat and BTB/POZ domain-containing protein 2-like [Ornithodoros turicata]
MTSVPAVPEFRDADQCRQHGVEIIRPKPRRLGDLNRAGPVAASHEVRLPGEGAAASGLKPSHRDLVGGSAPSLYKASGRDAMLKTPNRELSTSLCSPPPLPGKHSEKTSSHKSSSQPATPVCVASSPAPRVHSTPPVLTGGLRSTPVRESLARISPGLMLVTSRLSPAAKLSVPEPSRHFADTQRIEEEDEGVTTDGHFSPYRDSASNTDCGSLSKSSSDGDPVVSRRKPLTRLKSRRKNILSFPHGLNTDDLRLLQRRHDLYGGSSSDENRSSGHASMSDGGHSSYGSSPSACVDLSRGGHGHDPGAVVPLTKSLHNIPGHLKAVPEDDRVPSLPPSSSSSSRVCRRSGNATSSSSRRRYREDLDSGNPSNLDDICDAVEQLAVRTQQVSRTGYSTSTYSSVSGSESEPAVRRLIRHSSLETINTNITSADEFVWVDNHSRLVELQHVPWNNHDVLRVLQNGRLKDHLRRISMEVVPRLAFLLQRPLVRVAREAQRFARALGVCSKREISGALTVVLSPGLADSCVKACHRAAAIYTVSGDQMRLSKSARAGLQLPVGKFHRWACDVRLGTFVHEYAAIFLTAGMENLLEEMVLQCLPPETTLTASVLEAGISNNADLWGLFQPFSHLNAGRTATGALSMPRWPGQTGGSSHHPMTTTSHHQSEDSSRVPSSKSHDQNFLTTCVGNLPELGDLLGKVMQFYNHKMSQSGQRASIPWGPSALHTLFYYMRCSQLEHSDHRHMHRSPAPELVYERPYQVLPPLVEWVCVAVAHAEHRRSLVVDQDDVMQAARLLLPGVDCPVRRFGSRSEEQVLSRRHADEKECTRHLQTELAFGLVRSGRTDLLSRALQLLPPQGLDTRDEHGLTPLMLACVGGDEALVQLLLDAGASVDAETPPCSQQYPCTVPETQHWTSLTYATTRGMLAIVRLLLEKGANVEGGARLSEDKITETPLQIAAASGHLDLISLLLSYGAHPFLSTLFRDAQSYGGAQQRGCYSAIAVAAAHGQRTVLHRLLSHPLAGDTRDMLSLEEILAEGANQMTSDRRAARLKVVPASMEDINKQPTKEGQVIKLTKTQMKALQEAMYQSSENGYLEITLDLRNIGVPWALHCWMQTLTTAHEQHLENIIDELLQDFLHVWPEDCSSQFVDECLPLLFSIFRHSKNEGTTLLLADIFSSCYGKEQIKEIRDVSFAGGARIDPKYVNSPEMSDIQFRVESRAFYAHKIILVNASPRFKSMLSTKTADGNPPVVQINDIRYDIFQLVMQYLYKGGCEDFDLDQNDVLELMTAANFFQLDGLVRFCESRCSQYVDLDNIVSMYIHAKVYNAVQLLEYCQGFLLQNLVALLTYDDSVRKLLFGKRLHNHDVLSGLLLTLQARIKHRGSSPGGPVKSAHSGVKR